MRLFIVGYLSGILTEGLPGTSSCPHPIKEVNRVVLYQKRDTGLLGITCLPLESRDSSTTIRTKERRDKSNFEEIFRGLKGFFFFFSKIKMVLGFNQ